MADNVEINFAGQMRGKLAKRFSDEAKRRDIEPATLAANILEAVAQHNLFAAVLDD